jgi:probable HAF family extracellular repeat protein
MLIAYLWNNDTPTTLGSLPGGVSSSAFRINEVGHSAGVIYLDPSVDANIPVRFDGTTATPLQVFGGGTQMYGTTAYAINNQDVLVGETWSEKFLYIRPVRWDGTAITDLGTLGGRYGSAVAINDSGQIHGLSNTAFDEAIHATLWDNGAIIDLGTLGGSTSSINDNNNLAQAVGAFGTEPQSPSYPAWAERVLSQWPHRSIISATLWARWKMATRHCGKTAK